MPLYGSSQQNKNEPKSSFKVNDDGSIEELPGFQLLMPGHPLFIGKIKDSKARYDEQAKEYPYKSLAEAITASNKKILSNINEVKTGYSKKLEDLASREGTYNTLASQIAGLTAGGGRSLYAGGTPNFDESTGTYRLSAGQNFGASDISSKLNFQVSDQQILDDYNNTRLGRLNRIVSDGNSQIAGIQA
ncbi:MAG: hypothetical protein EBR82_56545, partial [Caulobacteraceae bacterium]|nr:hypothetical protein [Caulobacteraceae bacterium]